MSPAEAACPRCHARLDVALLRDTGAQTCPFCEADISQELDNAAENPAETSLERDAPWRGGGHGPDVGLVRPLPPDSRLQVLQAEGGRLVLFLPPGGRGGNSLWVFALLFTAILVLLTTTLVLALVLGPARQPGNPLVIVATLGVFWLVALGLWWGALKMRYQRTLLSVDRERVVLQTTLFGKTRQQELPVLDTTECSLEEAYSVNEVPVYRVRVANGHQSLGFATNLDQDDKDWLVDQIVQMLGNASPAESTAEVPASSEISPLGERQTATDPGTSQGWSIGAEPVSPGELPPESAITILEEGSGLLLFSFATLPGRTTRFVLPALMLGFLVFWLWWVGLFVWRMWQPGALWPFRVIPFVMLAMGLLPLAGMLWMALGRTTVRLTRDRLECHWGRGLLGFRRSLPVDSIEAIVLGGLSPVANPGIRRSGERARSVRTESTGCAVTGAGRWLLIAPFADRELSRQVGGLLLGKLQSWGRMVETRMGGFGDSRLTS